jgi:hypothetical protein
MSVNPSAGAWSPAHNLPAIAMSEPVPGGGQLIFARCALGIAALISRWMPGCSCLHCGSFEGTTNNI